MNHPKKKFEQIAAEPDQITKRMDAALLLQENQMLQQRVSGLEAELKLWRQKVDRLLKLLYGVSSEKISDAQLQLLMAGFELPAPVPGPPPPGLLDRDKPASSRTAKTSSVRGGGLPKDLETQEIVLEPEEVKAAPEQWQKIGQEVTEELDFTPGRVLRKLYIRPKYVPLPKASAPASEPARSPSDVVSEVWAELEEQKAVVIAPLPPRLVEKGYVGPGLMAHIVISKYEDHLPLYRQEKIFRERYGITIRRQSLCEWVGAAAWWLKPIYEEMRKGLMASGYLQADETPIRYLDPDRPGKAQMGYLWTYSKPGLDVIFEWQTSRSKEAPAKFLKDFNGYLQTDAYGVYTSLAKDRGGEVTLVGCWAHARRNFVEALEEDRRVGWFVRQIGHLYGVEKKLREIRAGPNLRQARRAAESKPVLDRLRKALERMASKVLPKSKFGEAISYALNQWETLIRYVQNGQLEIDNNLIENAIRPTALGKKNFLFIGHPEAGWHSAVIYSILGSCRRHGINPHEYLRDVLSRLPSATNQQIPDFTPAAWAKAHKKSPAKQGS
ncbi:MAG: IS66 family transposase [Actinobacteria bacterium]|nr:IS66 family transposase [Actinomycetota bacterium]